MAKPSLYLETTIVSYLTAWPSRDLVMAARQQVTREWWEKRRSHFDIYISQFVLEEAGQGDLEAAQRRLAVLKGMPLLTATDQVRDLAASLLRARAMPHKALTDALHIASAAVHEIGFLMTWNCAHLANAETMETVRQVILAAG
jgi:predicted nucleic acid-binding protein